MNKIALIDKNNRKVTYGELHNFVASFANKFTSNDNQIKQVGDRMFVIILMDNTIESIINYVSCIHNKIVPLLLDKNVEKEVLVEYVDKFKVNYILDGDRIIKVSDKLVELNPELALLLTTSGSTGGKKCVRVSYNNLESNTISIINDLKIDKNDITITSLPLYYTFGLSLINTYLYNHSTILVTNESPIRKTFWDFFDENNGTSFSSVPYTYDVLRKFGFNKWNLESLSVLTVAGGKISTESEDYYTDYCNVGNKRFYIMYGQTEATARISIRPADLVKEMKGTIGNVISGGKMWIEDESGKRITTPYEKGELIFSGENVTMGYAYSVDDLKKCDERNRILRTNDQAYMDEKGYFYVTDRKDRTAKINGIRIDLEGVEKLVMAKTLKDEGISINCSVIKCYDEKYDKKLLVKCSKEIDKEMNMKIKEFIHSRFNISTKLIEVEKM